MTSQTKAEKAKIRGLRAAQNPAKFFHFSSVKVDMLLYFFLLLTFSNDLDLTALFKYPNFGRK